MLGVGGVPRGRGEGGKPFACPLVLVATFADGIFIFSRFFFAIRCIWRLLQKECLLQPPRGIIFEVWLLRRKWDVLFFDNWHACIATLHCYMRAYCYMQTVCEGMERSKVKRNERAVCLLPFLERETSRTRRYSESGGGMKYGRSERNWKKN